MRRLLGSLVVLIAIVVVIGIWRGWFDFRSNSREGDGNRTYSVDVNRTQIAKDTAVVGQSARQVGERIKENVENVAGQHSANGIIIRVERKDKLLQIRTSENKELTIAIEPSTKIVENEESVQLDGLRDGERVWITYSVQDGKNVAQSITVLPTS